MLTRPFRLALGIGAWVLAPALASAQVHQELLTQLTDRVPVGAIVYVTDTKGVTIKGRLAAVVDDAVRLNVANGPRTIAVADISRIQSQNPDTSLNGTLIGAAIGAIPGIYWLIVDPNECTGLCPEDYVSIAAGATIGWLIDRSVHKKVTVYTAAPTGTRSSTVTTLPSSLGIERACSSR